MTKRHQQLALALLSYIWILLWQHSGVPFTPSQSQLRPDDALVHETRMEVTYITVQEALTVNPHDSQTPYLQFPYLLIYLLQPLASIHHFLARGWMCICVEWWKNQAETHSQIKSNKAKLCFYLQVSDIALLTVYLVAHFPHFCAFCWWFCSFKCPPRHSAEVLSGAPKRKKDGMCFWRRYISFRTHKLQCCFLWVQC